MVRTDHGKVWSEPQIPAGKKFDFYGSVWLEQKPDLCFLYADVFGDHDYVQHLVAGTIFAGCFESYTLSDNFARGGLFGERIWTRLS